MQLIVQLIEEDITITESQKKLVFAPEVIQEIRIVAEWFLTISDPFTV